MSGSQVEAESISIFYSYAYEDRGFLTALDDRLITLKRRGLIKTWSDQEVDLGKNESDTISAHLNSAQIILLLVSPSYINNETCYAQMQQARERELTDDVVVVPVLVRPTPGLEETPINDWKKLPTDDKPITDWQSRDAAYVNIFNGIRRVAERLQHSQQNVPSNLRNLRASPLGFDSAGVYPRTNLVQETYDKLIMPETSALVLTGMGGVGKSTLATLVLKYAEERRQAGIGPFTGEALRFELNATNTLLDLLEALRLALGMPVLHHANLTGQEQAAELFNILYRCDTPRLILLDQFDVWLESGTGVVRPEQIGVAEWLDGINSKAGACRLLLTARVWPQGAQLYQPRLMVDFPVRSLQKEEGIALLRQRGLQDSEADLELAVEYCRGLPLALILLDKLKHREHLRLSTLLSDPEYKQLWIEDVRHNLFDTIYEQQLDEDQRHLLFAFSVYRTPVPKQAAQALIQNTLSQEQSATALHLLQASGLLQRRVATEGSYELHPLIAEFVRQRFLTEVANTNRGSLSDAHGRAALYYMRQHGYRSQSQPRWDVEDVRNIIEAVWHYCQAGQQQRAYDLIVQENIFVDLHRWGYNATLLELYTLLLPTANWQPVPEQAGRIYNDIGDIYSGLGQKSKAQQYYELALAIFRQNRIRLDEVKALINLGTISRLYNQLEQALTYYQEGMRINDEDGDYIPEKGILLHNIGRVYQSFGKREKTISARDKQYMQALEYYEQALRFYDSAKNSSEEARTQNNIGEVYAAVGQNEKAEQYYHTALDLFLELGERRGEGIIYSNLATLHGEKGEDESAFEYYVQALAIFREIGDRWEEAGVLKNLGRLFFIVPRYDAALACFWLAADMGEAIHKNVGSAAVPEGMRRFLGEERFELLWSQAEDHAALIVEQAIRAGIATGETEVADADGKHQD